MTTTDRTAEQNDVIAHQAAAQRIAAAAEKTAARELAAILERAQARKMAQAVPHLAATVGAAATAPDVISELRVLFTEPAAALEQLIARGVLRYDEETAHVLVPMG